MSLPAHVRFVRSANVVEADVDGGVIVLDIESAYCYGLNETASTIWRMLAEPVAFPEIRDRLLAQFDVEPETCARELEALLLDLETEGILARA